MAQWTYYLIKQYVYIVSKPGYERLTLDHPIIAYAKFPEKLAVSEKLLFHPDSNMHLLIFIDLWMSETDKLNQLKMEDNALLRKIDAFTKIV